jgi:hypothetical protein
MNTRDGDYDKPQRRAKKPSVLSEPLQRRLNAYAMAAASAGVAALACAPPAEGAPVCRVTPKELSHTINLSFNPASQALPPFQIAQTTFSYVSSNYLYSWWWNRGFFTPNSKGANLLLAPNGYAASVLPGSPIGPAGTFGKGASYGLLFSYGLGSWDNYRKYGHGTKLKHRGNLNFKNAENFFGFEFSLNGKIHYGWLRLHVTFHHYQHHAVWTQTIIHLDSYGYETTPNTAIAAGSCTGAEDIGATDANTTLPPQNASLGVLALGSDGLPLWRKPD